MQIRSAAVAGMFYPADPRRLQAAVAGYLEAARSRAPGRIRAPKALVAPHAGYVYSGPIAASAYRMLESRAAAIERVVLAGPSHRVYVRGLAVPTTRAFRTPLGDVPVDVEAVRRIRALPQVVVSDPAHDLEHSLEVHLPFLQTTLGAFSLVPLSVGEATYDEVAEVFEALWGGPETLIVVSTDLSHYLDQSSAQAIDGATCRAVEEMAPGDIGREQACGRIPLGGLLQAARAHGMTVETLDLRTSADTAGDPARVVGYGAWGIGTEGDP